MSLRYTPDIPIPYRRTQSEAVIDRMYQSVRV